VSQERVERRGATKRLEPLELAEAAVFADLTVGLCLFGWFLPLGGLVTAAAVAPMAALGARHRLGTVVAGGVCAGVISMLIGGVGLSGNAVGCAVLGGVVGLAERHRWSRTRTLVVAATTVWPVVTAVVLALLAVFSSLRELLLVQVVNAWRGVSKVLSHLHLESLANRGDVVVGWLVDHWWFTVSCALLVGLEAALFVAQSLARPTLFRLAAAAPRRGRWGASDTRAPAPVPVIARQVSFRYPGDSRPALDGVSMYVGERELVAVEGPNGSGKSTLARLLAGTPPTAGTIERPGAVGLGRRDGTALVFQRPETQVLGMRVRDDVVWGLPRDQWPDIEAELQRVGLDGFADRDTSTLSGGELQRLAVAAALARRPALLISDETTAMIDEDGRDQMLALLVRLREQGLSVVHITHRPQETAAAEQVVRLDNGRRVDHRAASANDHTVGLAVEPSAAPPLIRLRGVGHIYDAGSPWAHRALQDVDLDIARGAGLLIHGPNGSGKSTLAWILAGLLAPTEGSATLAGAPLSRQLDRLGLSFQHARLQLQRNTVLADVQAAAGIGEDDASKALEALGLDPTIYGTRGVDELSGGQQRRVALAGLLAANPDVLVLDEPFAGLDRDGREDLVTILADLRQQGTTFVLVSHDLDDPRLLTDHTVKLEDGRIVSDTRPPVELDRPPAPSVPERRRMELRLFRVLPTESPLHRVWAGTKLLALVALAVFVSLDPSWPAIGVTAATVCLGLAVARVPRGAAPRLPKWVGIALGITFATNLVAGGAPYLDVGPFRIGLGAEGHWLLATALGVTVIVAAALVSWTTPLAQVPAAVHRLIRPLRRIRLPVQYWAAAVGLGLRGLPILIDELQTLIAARRMRANHAPPPAPRWRHQLREPIDLLAAAIVTAARRAGEFADAVEARGGAVSTAESAPGLTFRDLVVAVVVCTTIALGIFLSARPW
jgi:energy-coupling factor transport system ATP-binding protein